MLGLAPTELVSEAERRLYAVLTSLGPGSGVLGGLAVFVPVVDGPRQRRQADAVVFLPETLIVVRAVSAGSRQAGELRPSPTGMWTVGGEVLRLSGGGANPSGQLRRAVELVETTIRAGELDPGSPAALAAIDGSITGVRDRTAGGPVACSLDAGDVLTGLRHCANRGSRADRRVWTTADVRAVLTIFGLHGRGPSVEELNNEGFLYSPYVLRRPREAAPAGAAVGSPAGGSTPPPRPGSGGAGSGAALLATGPGAPVAGSAAATRAGTPPRFVPPSAPGPRPDARHRPPPVAAPPAEPTEDGAEGTTDRDGDDVGLGGLFDAAEGPAAAPPATAPPSAGANRPHVRPAPDRTRPGVRRAALLLAALALVALAAWAGLSYAGRAGLDAEGSPSDRPTSTAVPSDPTTTTPSPTTPAAIVVDDLTFTLLRSQSDGDCAANSYGQVAEYFTATPCVGLTRALYTTTVAGQSAVVSVSDVELPDEDTAAEFRAVVDTNGTGNVSDLLRSGLVVEGLPAEVSADAYASSVTGAVVRIVEVDQLADGGDPAALDAAADSALQLPPPTA